MELSYVTMIFIMVTCTKIDSQKIELEFKRPSSPCASGLRRGKDKFVIHGSVGPKYLDLLASGWEDKIKIEVLTITSTQYVLVCPLIIGPDGIFCNRESTAACYCDHMNTTGSANIVINSIAKLSQSQGIIRAAWKHRNGSSIYSSNSIKLPKIYDQNSVTLILKVNGNPASKPVTCGRNFKPYDVNTVELCCYDTASPCYPQLIFDEVLVTEEYTECVNYTFTLHNESYSVRVTKSYSICNTDEIIKAGTCKVYTDPVPSDDYIILMILGVIGIIFVAMFAFILVMILRGCKNEITADAENKDLMPVSPKLDAEQQSVTSYKKEDNISVGRVTSFAESIV